MRRSWLSARLVLLVGVAVFPAAANIAAPQHNPSILHGAEPSTKTPLVIDGERLLIECVERAGEPSCQFEATYRVRNPTTQTLWVTPGFLSERVEDVTIFLDGKRADRELSGPEKQLLPPPAPAPVDPPPVDQPTYAQPPPGHPDAVEPAADPGDSDRSRMEGLVTGPVRGVDLEVAPGAVRELTARGRLTPGEYWEPHGYILIPARDARHMLLRPDYRSGLYTFEYFVAPIQTWGSVGPIDVIVRYPDAWEASVHAPGASGARPITDDRSEIRFTTDARDMSSLLVSFELPRANFHPGGPIAGIGGVLGDAGGFRMRFGWEVSEPDWLLYSLSADTNFGDELVVTPMVEAATPWVFVIPSLGAGVGMPYRWKPDKEFGLRLQATAAFGPVAWVTSFDFYPGVDKDRPDDRQVTMLFQLSL